MENTGSTWNLITLSEHDTGMLIEELSHDFDSRCYEFLDNDQMGAFISVDGSTGVRSIAVSPKLSQVSPDLLLKYGATPIPSDTSQSWNWEVLTPMDFKKSEKLLRSLAVIA